MSLSELEKAIVQLPEADLAAFARWFEEYMADEWDRRIEADGSLTFLVDDAQGGWTRPLKRPTRTLMADGARRCEALCYA